MASPTVAPGLEPLLVPLASLTLDPANARRHSQRNLAAIEASLRLYGQRKPIVVRRDGLVVEAGNGTVEAARQLGWTDLAAVIVDDDPVTAAAYGVADNRTAELAEWDDAALASLLAGLEQADVDLAGLGWDADELESLLPGPIDPTGEDPGPGEIPAEPVSVRGEIYALGPHRLMCGDATDADDVARLMDGEKARLFCTDPPYGVSANSTKDGIPGTGFSNQLARWGGDIAGDDLSDERLQAFLESAFRAALPHLDHAAWYLWHAHMSQVFFAAAAAAAGILLHRQIIWVKSNMVLTRSGQYHWRHEPCFYGWVRGQQPRWLADASTTSVWEIPHDPGDRVHPTQKPVALFERPIATHLLPGEVAYDAFAGSGSQIIAAAKTGRRCYAVEISPAYCDVIRRRWAGYARSAGIDPGTGAL